MGISTHILDTSRGRPASGVGIHLERQEGEHFVRVGGGVTNDDGRVPVLLGDEFTLEPGTYRARFLVDTYFKGLGVAAFYPSVTIEFVVVNPSEHFHVPLLLQPFGYSTYRGS